MAKNPFQPASKEHLKLRDEDILKKWASDFELRPGVKKNSDGSYDVKGDLNLFKDKIFRKGEFDPVLIRKYMRFRKVTGRFTARPTEFFLVLPKKVIGDVHMIGNLEKCIVGAGSTVAGRIVMTVIGW